MKFPFSLPSFLPSSVLALSPRVKNALPVALVVLVVISSAISAYFYREFDQIKRNPQKVAQEEQEALVAQVSKLMVLPENEIPTIATVSDPEKLKNQPFFAHSQIGDKVLIYTNARKAILYNPESNKIIEVAPVNIGNAK